MKDFESIFAYYCADPHALEALDYFADYEVNANNEVIALEIYDSEYYDLFPITDRLSEFIGEFKKLKRLEIEVEYVIKDLSPLRDLKELESISIESNTEIESLEFLRNMMNLKSIYLASSKVKNIDVLIDKKQLTSISLPYANIQDISPLYGLFELTWVSFYENEIENIDGLKNSRKIQSVYLGKNKIKRVEALRELHELQIIEISHNQIVDFTPIQYLKKINRINADCNQITNLDFLDGFNDLSNISIANNRVTNIDGLANCRQLTTVNAANNQIKDIRSLENCTQLLTLNIADNLIGNIDFLAKNEVLKELNISNNPIRSIQPLSNLKSIESLYASHLTELKIEDDFEFQSKISYLDLSFCNINNVLFLLNQDKVVELNLRNNQISSFDNSTAFPYLQYLNLQNNAIDTLFPVYHFGGILTVDLRGNSFGNQLFGKPSNYYRPYIQNRSVFETVEPSEQATIKDLEKIMADYYLEKGDIEAALAYYYFDNVNHNPQIDVRKLDISLYYLKHLANRKSPFFYNIRRRFFRALSPSVHTSSMTKKELDSYRKKVFDIDTIAIKKPRERLHPIQLHLYRHPNHLENYDKRFLPKLEELIAEEKEVLRGNIVTTGTTKRKRYERKTTSDNESTEVIGCSIWIIVTIVILTLMMSDTFPDEGRGVIVILIAVLKIGSHLYFKYR